MNHNHNRTHHMREARRSKQLTQLDLARRVGCTESQITKIETGRSRPDETLRRTIAAALGIHSWEVGV